MNKIGTIARNVLSIEYALIASLLAIVVLAALQFS